MPSTLPDGDPAPADGALPAAALARRGERPRGSTCTCRSARCGAATATSTPTRPPSSAAPDAAPGASRETYAEAARRRGPPRPAGAGRRRPPGRHGVLRRRHADAAGARGDLLSVLGAIEGEFGLADGAEVTTESNPDSVGPADLGDAAGGRHQPDLVRHAVRRPARAVGAGPDPRPRPGAARGRLGPGGRLRAGQPGPDLRHAGGVPRRLAAVARTRTRLRAGPRVGVRPHRRGRHRSGAAGAARARSRRPTTTTWPTSTSWPTRC